MGPCVGWVSYGRSHTEQQGSSSSRAGTSWRSSGSSSDSGTQESALGAPAHTTRNSRTAPRRRLNRMSATGNVASASGRGGGGSGSGAGSDAGDGAGCASGEASSCNSAIATSANCAARHCASDGGGAAASRNTSACDCGWWGKSEGRARVRLGAPDPSKGRIGREKTPTYILVKSPMSRRHLDLFHMTICHMGFQTTHSPPSMFQLTPEPVWNESRPSSNTLFLPSGTHC